jgi:hypothetical protein
MSIQRIDFDQKRSLVPFCAEGRELLPGIAGAAR